MGGRETARGRKGGVGGAGQSGNRKMGCNKWGFSDASASADFPAVLEVDPPTGNS